MRPARSQWTWCLVVTFGVASILVFFVSPSSPGDSRNLHTNARSRNAPCSQYISGSGGLPVAKSVADIWDVYCQNQQTRAGITTWVSKETLENSVFNYGINPRKTKVESLAQDIGQKPVLHDFVSQIGARMQAQGHVLRYMEIGTSVLKCIHTQSHFLRNATIIGFDIEDPNPAIEIHWEAKHTVASWSVSSERKKKHRKADYINSYRGPQWNAMYFLAGDATSDTSYANLYNTIVSKIGPINFILSDALHTGEAVTLEVTHLLRHQIIPNSAEQDFTMLWDDCDNPKELGEAVFNNNFPRLSAAFEGRRTCSGAFVMPGWLGEGEASHRACIFTTLDVSGPHLQASSSWQPESLWITCSS